MLLQHMFLYEIKQSKHIGSPSAWCTHRCISISKTWIADYMYLTVGLPLVREKFEGRKMSGILGGVTEIWDYEKSHGISGRVREIHGIQTVGNRNSSHAELALFNSCM